MTKDRDLGPRIKESDPGDYRTVTLTRFPGQELVILSSGVELVSVFVEEPLQPGNEGSIFSVNLKDEQIDRAEVDERTILHVEPGSFIVIKGERVRPNSRDAKIHITLQGKHRVVRREVLDRGNEESGGTSKSD